MSSATHTLSWETFRRDCRILADTIAQNVPRLDGFSGILAVTRGGLVPAALIAHFLDIRLIETVGVRAYVSDSVHATCLPEAQIYKTPAPDLGVGRGWIVIDDLTDTGVTFRALRARWPDAHYAAPYAKPQGAPLVDSVAVQVPQDVWVVFPWEH